MADTIRVKTTKREKTAGGWYTGKYQEIDLKPADIAAVSSLRTAAFCAIGQSIHMKDGHTHGTWENLSSVLTKAATVDPEALKNIRVIIQDRTPNYYGYPKADVRITADKAVSLDI